MSHRWVINFDGLRDIFYFCFWFWHISFYIDMKCFRIWYIFGGIEHLSHRINATISNAFSDLIFYVSEMAIKRIVPVMRRKGNVGYWNLKTKGGNVNY